MYKIKLNDIVKVTAGKDKGKRGKVLRLFPTERRAIIEGINLGKKHQRRTQKDQQQAGIIQLPAPIHISNLRLICKSCNRATRVGFIVLDDDTKARVCKKCKEPLT